MAKFISIKKKYQKMILKSISSLEKEFKVTVFPNRFFKYYCISTILKKIGI